MIQIKEIKKTPCQALAGNKKKKAQKNMPTLRFGEFSGDWDEKRLGEFGNFVGGGTPSKKISRYWDGDIAWISSSDILEKKSIPNTTRFITKEAVKNSATKIIPKNSLLIVSRVGVGKFAISNENLCTSQDFTNFLPDNNIDINFSFFLLKSKVKKLLSLVQGTSIKGFTKDDLENLKINIPQKKEQEKIAGFLDGVDDWLTNLEKQKEKLEKYKKGIMQKIFSPFCHSREGGNLDDCIRFKDENGKDFADWEERKSKDVFELTRGFVLAVKNMKQQKDDEYKYPVYSSQTKNDGLTGYYNEYLYEDALTWTTDGANAGQVNFRNGKFYCTNVSGVMISKDGYANQCTAEMLNLITKNYVSYVGNPKLMNNVMASIKLQFPSLPEQKKIAEFLSSIDKMIQLKQDQITKAQEWKKGLMQRLFV